jgi:hypothetical protein
MVDTGLSLVPIFGEGVQAYFDAKVRGHRPSPRAQSPLGAFVQSWGEVGLRLAEDDIDAPKTLESFVRAMGATLGVPTAQPLRTGKYLVGVLSGEREVDNAGDFVSGVIYGETDRKSATIPRVIGRAVGGE